jgi:hypothetical protein
MGTEFRLWIRSAGGGAATANDAWTRVSVRSSIQVISRNFGPQAGRSATRSDSTTLASPTWPAPPREGHVSEFHQQAGLRRLVSLP